MKVVWSNVVVAVIVMAVVAVLTQVASQVTEIGDDVAEVTPGDPGRIENAEITVTRVRLTRAITDELGTPSTCGDDCAFLVVTVEVTDRGRTELPLTTALEYAGVEAQAASPLIGQQAGYAITTQVPIAVDPTRLEGARFSVWPLEDFRVYPQRVTVDLGIDATERERLIAEAPASITIPVSAERRPL